MSSTPSCSPAATMNRRAAALPLLGEGGWFIGVGSAHLPGPEGLVELLRQSGYAVTMVE